MKTGKKRININFTDEAMANLNELSEGLSMSDVIRKSITIFKWAKDIKEDGGKILIEKDGKVREVELFI